MLLDAQRAVQIRDWPEDELPNSEKLAFFRETRHAFGRTALLLSGGGVYGTFHMGVCKALFENHMLPRVLAGSSAGAIVCAIVATRTEAELKELFDHILNFEFEFFSNSRTLQLLVHVIKEGTIQVRRRGREAVRGVADRCCSSVRQRAEP
eukprot:352337-Chlamydomonas_euryale.AAC.1